MPTTLLSANIKGIRSYSPDQPQTIDFMPLTLILGKNGTGKTSIIEALKFIIAGEEPPFSDSRRNFIHTPKESMPKPQQRSSYATIQLDFLNSQNEHCIAKREINHANLSKGPPQISSSYRMGQQSWQNINKQEDWSKTLPKIFDLQNPAILNNVILCHQENNLWCLDDSSSVKQIFDRIFGCEQYKREILYIDMELRKLRPDIAIYERDLLHYKEKVERKRYVEKHINICDEGIKGSLETEAKLDSRIETATSAKRKITERIADIESRTKHANMLSMKIEGLKRQEADYLSTHELRGDIKGLSSEELRARISEADAALLENNQQQDRYRKEEAQLRTSIKDSESQRLLLQKEADNIRVKKLNAVDQKDQMMKSLKKLIADFELDLSIDDSLTEEVLKALEGYEKELSEQKSDLVEREDTLSKDIRNSTRNFSALDGSLIGLQQKVKSKEAMVLRLTRQLGDADPVAKDLNHVVENVEKMNLLVIQLDVESEPVKNLQNLLTDTRQKLVNIGQKIGQENVAKIRDELEKERCDISECINKLQSLEKEREELRSHLKSLESQQSHVATSLKNIQNKLINFRANKSNLEHLYRLVKSNELKEGPGVESALDKLKDFSGTIEQMRKELDSASTQRASLNEEVVRIHKQQEVYKTALGARSIGQRISEAEKELSSMLQEVKDAEKLDQLKAEELEIDKKIRDMRERKSLLLGSRQQMEVELKRLLAESRTLSDLYKTYSSCLGKVVLWRIIEKDLLKLKECFNSSILAFHDRMIIKINQVLKMRWRQIYKGTDIDSIELVDEEIAKGRDKRYNYFIAMRKGNVRMKMREQASAGQKALASIIIRMTLAELFVKDFAFMALDEPTANLDKENVESLAKAVGQHVRRRAKNGVNIQWIIITHDEHFIKALDAECSPFYYRIHMDSSGHSKINKIAVSAVQEKEDA